MYIDKTLNVIINWLIIFNVSMFYIFAIKWGVLMFEKLEKNKVFRDPLYGNIQVEYKMH